MCISIIHDTNVTFIICRSAKTQWAFYGGPVVGESAIKHLNEVGPKVSHIYEVFNEGPWKVSTVEVRISWPYEVANDKAHGKWLLYMEEMPTIQGSIKLAFRLTFSQSENGRFIAL